MVRFFPHLQGWPLEFAPFLRILSVLGRLPKMPIMVSVDDPGDATVLARVLGDYPHPVILEGVSRTTLAEAVSVCRRHERLYIETHALHAPDALTQLRDTGGIGRVLFGSDAPGLSLGAALRSVQNAALSDADKSAVLSGNAQRIWQGGEE